MKRGNAREQARRKADFFRLSAVMEYAVSWLALEPLVEHSTLPRLWLIFWISVHVLSYLTMFFAVYLQVKALAYDYTKIDLKILFGTFLPSWERRCLMLPATLLSLLFDALVVWYFIL